MVGILEGGLCRTVKVTVHQSSVLTFLRHVLKIIMKNISFCPSPAIFYYEYFQMYSKVKVFGGKHHIITT